MARAIIRVVVSDIADEKVLELKKKIDAIVEKIPGAEVELTMLGR